jgi:peptidoglycan/xylan/chitin deacetylase (PgdA/CDA1 family)
MKSRRKAVASILTIFMLIFNIQGVLAEGNIGQNKLNMALNKAVTSSGYATNNEYSTDGRIDSNKYTSIEAGSQWIQLDFGENVNISKVKLWHYFDDSRKYKDVIVQISTDASFLTDVKTVFNNDADNSSKQGIGSDSEYMETKDGKEITFTTVSGRYVRLWTNGSSANEWNHLVEVEVYEASSTEPDPSIEVKPVNNTTNLALNKPVTSSGSISDSTFAVDGKIDGSKYSAIEPGPQWIQVDLGANYDITKIKLWHFFKDNRTYKDVIIHISTDAGFSRDVKTVFNNDKDNSAKLGTGIHAEYMETKDGKEIAFSKVIGRYVRVWSNGSTESKWNHIVELEVYGEQSRVTTDNKINIPHDKPITSSGSIKDSSYVVDGLIDSAKFASLESGLQWIQLDLGENFDINAIKLWHYFDDNRIYKDVIVQISTDLKFSKDVKTVFNNDRDNSAKLGIGTDAEYRETKDGKQITFDAVKGRYVRLWSNGSSKNEWNHYIEIQIYRAQSNIFDRSRLISYSSDIALGKGIRASGKITNDKYAVDGNVDSGKYSSIEPGLQWIQVDLGRDYDISLIRFWHNFTDSRTYKDVIVQISSDLNFEFTAKTVFNNDSDNSSGQGMGKDLEYMETDRGKEISMLPKKGRYIRLWSNGNNINGSNDYSEIEVVGTPSEDVQPMIFNSALNKSVKGSSAIDFPAYITDGKLDSGQYATVGRGAQWIIIDLGQMFDITAIDLWHLYEDKRVYKDVIVQLSNDKDFNVKDYDEEDYNGEVFTVFNNDSDNSSIQGVGKDSEYTEDKKGKRVFNGNITARYIRFWSNGNSVDQYNHYSEIAVFGAPTYGETPSSDNSAAGKIITKVPIVMYHSITEKSDNIYQISAKDFDSQLKYLKDNGYTTLTLEQYYELMRKPDNSIKKPILITFDDGWLDNYTIALPILKKYDFKATIFIPSSFVDNPGRVSTEQVRKLIAEGIDIAIHGLNHERMQDYNYYEQYEIIKEAKEKLGKIANKKIDYYAYAYGSFDINTISICERLGFKIGFSSLEGISTNIDNPYAVKRIFLSGEDTLDNFINKISN